MDLSLLTPTLLKELLQLAESKEKILREIAALEERASALLSDHPAAPSKKISARTGKSPGGVLKKKKRGEGIAAIIKVIKAAGPGGLSASDVARQAGISPAYANVALSSLLKKGSVQRLGRGIYAIVMPQALAASAELANMGAIDPQL